MSSISDFLKEARALVGQGLKPADQTTSPRVNGRTITIKRGKASRNIFTENITSPSSNNTSPSLRPGPSSLVLPPLNLAGPNQSTTRRPRTFSNASAETGVSEHKASLSPTSSPETSWIALPPLNLAVGSQSPGSASITSDSSSSGSPQMPPRNGKHAPVSVSATLNVPTQRQLFPAFSVAAQQLRSPKPRQQFPDFSDPSEEDASSENYRVVVNMNDVKEVIVPTERTSEEVVPETVRVVDNFLKEMTRGDFFKKITSSKPSEAKIIYGVFIRAFNEHKEELLANLENRLKEGNEQYRFLLAKNFGQYLLTNRTYDFSNPNADSYLAVLLQQASVAAPTAALFVIACYQGDVGYITKCFHETNFDLKIEVQSSFLKDKRVVSLIPMEALEKLSHEIQLKIAAILANIN